MKGNISRIIGSGSVGVIISTVAMKMLLIPAIPIAVAIEHYEILKNIGGVVLFLWLVATLWVGVIAYMRTYKYMYKIISNLNDV